MLNTVFTMGVCILLRMYQLSSKTPSFATSISACFISCTLFTTCFGPDQRPSSCDNSGDCMIHLKMAVDQGRNMS
jgi:hypothetical protein